MAVRGPQHVRWPGRAPSARPGICARSSTYVGTSEPARALQGGSRTIGVIVERGEGNIQDCVEANCLFQDCMDTQGLAFRDRYTAGHERGTDCVPSRRRGTGRSAVHIPTGNIRSTGQGQETLGRVARQVARMEGLIEGACLFRPVEGPTPAAADQAP